MLSLVKKLRRHPFAMTAFFRRSLVLSYAFPKKVLEPLLDPGLLLDHYADQGFVAIALVETERLRPRGMPAWLGKNFFLMGFRVFVKFTPREGKTLRGLKILKSLTDSSSMARIGNIFTGYDWKKSDIRSKDLPGGIWELHAGDASQDPRLHLRIDLSRENASLPPESPFPDLKTARKFAGPLPHTFSYEKDAQKVIVVKGRRKNWNPRPVSVEVIRNSFFSEPPFKDAVPKLANAFFLENIPYEWDAGKVESAV